MAEQRVIADFNDKEVSKFIKNLSAKLKDIKGGKQKYLGLLSVIIFADVMDHFSKEQGPDGPWEKWSRTYTDRLTKDGRAGNKKLQYNGRLRNSFTPKDVRHTSRGILWFNNAITKSGYPYAAGHNYGDGQLPQREFMWMSDKAFEKIEVQTLQFMLDEGV